VQEGDTCSGIAATFGTSVEALANLNGLDADCNLIRIGDVFQIPVRDQRRDIDRADLDCDGQVERLQASPAVGRTEEWLFYGIYLQVLSDTGLYQDVWQITAEGEQADYLAFLNPIKLVNCQNFVSVEIVNGNARTLRVFHWSDGQMQMVLDRGSAAMGGTTSAQDALMIYEQTSDPSSICQRWLVTYRWDGEALVETERIIDPNGGTC
jgi:LysM repeat protein